MKRITKKELDEFLRKHKLWLEDKEGGERAYLSGADLSGANLSGADLSGANLSRANLSRANLSRANLSRAIFDGVKLPLACPEKGSFVGFKKCIGNRIVELEILSDSKRSSATTRKCRCSKARVISITDIDGSTTYEEAVSSYDLNFKYRVGTTVVVDNFDENRWNECSTGIHFFITRQEAVDYCV